MNLLLLSVFVITYAVTAESRYPYEDTYTSGDIVPGLNGRYTNGRESGYARKYERGKYPGLLPKRNIGYGRNRDDALLNRDYRRRYKDYDYYLPPRGIGNYNRGYQRPGYDYGRERRTQISGPPRYYDEDEIDYGGYRRSNVGGGGRTRYI